MNSLNFCLSGKLLISPSNLKESLAEWFSWWVQKSESLGSWDSWRHKHTGLSQDVQCDWWCVATDGPAQKTRDVHLPVPSATAILARPFVVQLLSCVRLFVIPWTAACQASLPFIIYLSLLKLMSIESGKVVWYSYLFKKIPQFGVIHTVKGFSIVNEAQVDVF